MGYESNLSKHPQRGLMFILSSPSGAGKTSLAKALLETNSNLAMSTSVTTRPPRPGEKNGEDYFFISQEAFDAYVQHDAFLEHACVFGSAYGTLRAPVEAFLTEGYDVLFDIDWQGAQQLFRTAAADVVRIFILPPSLRELRERLYKRSQDTAEVVEARMAKAKDEMSHWAEYDYVLVNEVFQETLAHLQAIFHAERFKRERQPGLASFVKHLFNS